MGSNPKHRAFRSPKLGENEPLAAILTSSALSIYPQHYHLRRKILQGNPLLVSVCTDLLPWDPHKQIRHTWISEPQLDYGPYFDDFCLSIGPRKQVFQSSTRSLGDWNKKKTRYSAQGEENGCKSDEEKGRERGTQYWVLNEFCNSFDPRLPLRLLTESPGIPRVVGHDLRMIIFVPNLTWSRPDHLILVNATRLQGKYYDNNIKCKVYWRTQTAGDRVIPIVINTGASISITGEWNDFFEGIKDVGPDERIQGLNHSIQVKGIGRIRWKI
jgi:hypothetical protein